MAHRFFLDANALAKHYVPETGSGMVDYLFQRVPRPPLLCLTLGTLEVVSILVRKRNVGVLTQAGFDQALVDFRYEVVSAANIAKVKVADHLVYSAFGLVQAHSINSTDAVLLGAALLLAGRLRRAGEDLVLVASDLRLLRAAQAEGVLTFNPATQAQTDLDALLGP